MNLQCHCTYCVLKSSTFVQCTPELYVYSLHQILFIVYFPEIYLHQRTPEKYLWCSPEKYLGCSPEQYRWCTPEKYLWCSPEKDLWCSPEKYLRCTSEKKTYGVHQKSMYGVHQKMIYRVHQKIIYRVHQKSIYSVHQPSELAVASQYTRDLWAERSLRQETRQSVHEYFCTLEDGRSTP